MTELQELQERLSMIKKIVQRESKNSKTLEQLDIVQEKIYDVSDEIDTEDEDLSTYVISKIDEISDSLTRIYTDL